MRNRTKKWLTALRRMILALAIIIGYGAVNANAASPPVVVTGKSPTKDTTPTWTWTSGGGNGFYRYRLDDGDWGLKTQTRIFTPATALLEGQHTLYVQEKDALGKWSGPGNKAIIIDLTPPNPPVVDGVSPTFDTTPTWTWASGGGDCGVYRYKLDVATETTETSFTPDNPLPVGKHTLYVQARDKANNWSTMGSKAIKINTQPVTVGLKLVKLSNYDGFTGRLTGYITYKYNAAGKVAKTSFYQSQGLVTLYITYEYNQAGKVVKTTSYNGLTEELFAYTTYEYNEAGKEVKKSTYSGLTEILTEYVMTEYNAAGNITKISKYGIQGLLTSYTTYEYNEVGKEVKKSTYNGLTGILTEYVMTEYNAEGNITKISKYNLLGLLTEYNTYEYNAEGSPVKISVYGPTDLLTQYSTMEYRK